MIKIMPSFFIKADTKIMFVFSWKLKALSSKIICIIESFNKDSLNSLWIKQQVSPFSLWKTPQDNHTMLFQSPNSGNTLCINKKFKNSGKKK